MPPYSQIPLDSLQSTAMADTTSIIRQLIHIMSGPTIILLGLVIFTGLFAGMMALFHMGVEAKERERRERRDNERWERERAVS